MLLLQSKPKGVLISGSKWSIKQVTASKLALASHGCKHRTLCRTDYCDLKFYFTDFTAESQGRIFYSAVTLVMITGVRS